MLLLKKNILIITMSTLLMMFFASQLAIAKPSNAQLEEKVRLSIGDRYDEDVDVDVRPDGTVELMGDVATYYDKLNVYKIVSKINGVKKISNQIAVNTPKLPNNLVKQNIVQEIELVNSIYEPDQIEVSVDNGMVLLKGKVSFNREKHMAETVASWQKGVRGVVNQIKVLPKKKVKSDDHLKTVLKRVMEDQFPLEDNVNFTINDGVVTVSGTARTVWAKDEIEDVFESIMGVKKVKNNLTVEPSYAS
jgi:osmotically-inducible protein OsmY